jgi:hypothetical protein
MHLARDNLNALIPPGDIATPAQNERVLPETLIMRGAANVIRRHSAEITQLRSERDQARTRVALAATTPPPPPVYTAATHTQINRTNDARMGNAVSLTHS